MFTEIVITSEKIFVKMTPLQKHEARRNLETEIIANQT